MSKKKGKKKREKQFNPHKLGEQELKDKIDHLLSRQSVDEAYSLAKVLLERFESQGNIAVFQSTLNQKIRNLEALGKSHEAPKLIAEAKKRFSGGSLFQGVDELVRLKNLGDAQVLEHFLAKQKIPEDFHHQIADILFFSKKPDRQFIKQHAEYKDVFYVKEAFQNGYDPVKTPKILSAIKSDSPYRIWHLLHKGIQAFLESDAESLQLIVKKLPQGHFPAFIVSKLQNYQNYLDGKSDINAIDKDDLEIFKTICGEHCALVAVLSEITSPQKNTPLHRHPGKLNWIKKNYSEQFGEILYLLLSGVYAVVELSNKDINYAQQLINLINRPEELAIDSDHLFLKLSGYRFYNSYQLEDVFDQVIDSTDRAKSLLFDSGLLNSEILFHYIKTLEAPGNHSGSFFDRLFNHWDDQSPADKSIQLLEEAIKYSDHNPKMHTLLIEYYRKTKTKTSVINKAVDRFLSKFPANPEGFDLAGKIALDNKTYKKAIDFFSKAKELMPLNRELIETVLDCYEGIIDKINKSNHHLIDKDLNSALAYVGSNQASLMERYGLLETKALLKKLSLSQIDLKTFRQEFSNRYPSLPKNDRITLKLVLLLIKSQDTTPNLDQSLDSILAQVRNNLKPDTYLLFLQYALKDDVETPPFFFIIFSELTLHFIEQKKVHRSLTIDQHFELMLLAIANEWNRSFMAFVCLAFDSFPEHKVLVLLKNILLTKVNHNKIKALFYDEEVVKWFCSPVGKKFLSQLAEYNDIFEELHLLLTESNVIPLKEVIHEIYTLFEDFPNSFTNFSSFLLEDCDDDDLLDLQSIRKTFDISIRIIFSKKAVFAPYEEDEEVPYEEYVRLQRKAEKQEKEWEEEQKRKKENREKQQELKKKIEEEMETKNEQIDLFDMLDNEESR